MSRGILVITSCTATKVHTPNGEEHCAESLYAGQQHLRLMRGVDRYREAGRSAGPLSFRILSAYYGLLTPNTAVPTYDHSFSGLPTETIRRLGRERNVPQDIRTVLRKSFALGLLLLGDHYLRACDLDTEVKLAGPTIAFCSPKMARWLPPLDGLRIVELSNREARRFSCGLIALKGELGGRILCALSEHPEILSTLTSPDLDLLDWLEAMPPTSLPEHQLAAAG